MGETHVHVLLVRKIVEWILSEDPYALVCMDSSYSKDIRNRPPNIRGHIPDVFATASDLTKETIGEAKTRWDIENEHTENQLKAFISYSAINKNVKVVIAVPWDMRACARNMTKKLKRECGCEEVNVEIIDCFYE